MAVYCICFSLTGGTKKVMSHLSSAWQKTVFVDLSVPHEDYSRFTFSRNDLCLIGVPVFEGRVPSVALQRIREMKAANTPAILVAVFGNRNINDALLELKNTVATVGFLPFAAVSAVAQHSLFPTVAAGRPDEKDAEELRAFSLRIKKYYEDNDSPSWVNVPGQEPYIVILRPSDISTENGEPLSADTVLQKPYFLLRTPHVYPAFNAEKCSNCMICAEQCPVTAIAKDDLSIVNRAVCIHCMRCVSVCPTGARQIDPICQAQAFTHLKKAFQDRKPNSLYL